MVTTEPAVVSAAKPTTSMWSSLLGAFGVASVMGLPLGVAWYLLAPHITFVVREDGVYAGDDAPTDWFGVDGWFFIVGLGLGVLAGVIGYWRWRQRPVAALVGLAVGGLLAGWLGVQIGRLLGPSTIDASALDAPVGTVIPAPLDILATGTLLAVGFAAVLTFGLFVALERSEPEPAEPDDSVEGSEDAAQS